MSRALSLLLAALLCLVACVHALGASDAVETARQAADSANDSAVGVEERQASLKKLEEAARLYLGAGESEEAARALNRAGRLHLILNAPEGALDTHRKALALLKQRPAPEVEVDGLNGMAAAFALLKKVDRVEESLRRSLALSEQSGYARGRAQALLTLSDIQNYHNHVLGLQTAHAALALWQSIGDRAGIARAHAQVGICQMAQSNLSEAQQNYEQALQIWRELSNASEQAGALINLGFIEFRKGEWQNEISLMTQAQSLLDEKAEPERMGQTFAGLAEAFRESGMPEVGIMHYGRALDYYRRTQDPHLIWYATWELGCTYYLQGNYPEALAYLRQPIEGIARDGVEAAQTNQYLGRVYIAKGEYADALKYLQFALDIFTRAVNPKEAAQVRALMGQIYGQQGKIQKAREFYQTALETFRALSDDVNQSATLYALGSFELKQNNLEAAEDYLRRSIEVTENMRRVSTSRDLTAAFSATVHERYESYIECLMRRNGAGAARELEVRAFEMSEMSRARSLAELLRASATDISLGLDPQLAGQEKSLRQSLHVKANYRVALLGKTYKKEELDALEAELARLEAEYKQVNENIRARFPSYGQITRPIAWDLRRIQEQVIADDETLLLEYSLGAEKSYVWAVTRDHITSHEMPSRQLVGEAAQRVYKLLSTQPDAETDLELTRAAHELSRIILAPVADRLGKRRIIVVADGALNYIPFQFLPSPTDNEPLVATREIVNAPSASILGQLRQETERRAAPTKTLAAFGDPVFASDYAQRKGADGDAQQIASAQTPGAERWRHALRDLELNGDSFDPSVIGRLFYAKRELANLRSVAGGGENLVAADYDATRERLRSTDLTQFSILHFATHGFLDPVRPENSGLILSTVDHEGRTQDGFVGLQEIYTLRAPVDLVVLSACSTALGKEVRGEGLIGLTRGFMYAGASSVVSSLWKVDDEATAELMKRFYANMLELGMTPASALRAAQNSIRQEPQWRSPFYWAAFTFQGEHRRVITPASAGSASVRVKLFALAALLMLLAGVVWLYRRKRGARAARWAGPYSTLNK